MTQQISGPKRLFSNLEKILIALIFVSIVILYVATGGSKDLKKYNGYIVVLAMEILLALYYIYLTRNLYSLFLVGFVLLNIGYLLLNSSSYALANNLILAGKFALFCLGLFLGYKTVTESLKNRDWELFGTLITLALLFPLIHHFYFASNEDYLMVYHFALAFMLGTIIYNENLWDKYNTSEKKLLTFILIWLMLLSQ